MNAFFSKTNLENRSHKKCPLISGQEATQMFSQRNNPYCELLSMVTKLIIFFIKKMRVPVKFQIKILLILYALKILIMAKNILGLDLGTNSIGWAHVIEGDSPENSSIVQIGVRVNPLTTDEQTNFEKGKPITTNADRTLKRGMRRNLDRYQLRREHLIDALKKANII